MGQGKGRRQREPTNVEQYLRWRLQGLRGQRSWTDFATALGLPRGTVYAAGELGECGYGALGRIASALGTTREEVEQLACEWRLRQRAPFRESTVVRRK